MKIYNILFIFITLGVSFINAGNILNDYIERRSQENYNGLINIKRDIYYKKDKLLDVHYDIEDVNNKKPVVVFIYGGGWALGGRACYCRFGQIFEEHGYVAVLPEYVLYPDGKFDDMVEDVHDAIEWTYKNIKRFGGDPNNISITGHSAGGHLITLTTIDTALGIKVNGKVLSPLPPINKFVSMMGVMDFDNVDITELLFYKSYDHSFTELLYRFLMSSKNISPTDILNKYKGRPFTTLGPKSMTFLDSNADALVHPAHAEGVIKAIERVCPDCETHHKTIEGYGHRDFIFCFLGIDENYKKTYSKKCDEFIVSLFK